MRVLELAKRRKTVRVFSNEVPPLGDILKAIEAAKEAPSGMNHQPWHFLVVNDPGIKAEVRRICEKAERTFHERVRGKLGEWLREKGITWRKDFLERAPYLILVFAYRKAPYSVQSVWLAVGYLLLALEELGLSSLTYTPPNPSDLERFLKVPGDWNLQVVIPVGYGSDPKPKYERFSLERVYSLNEFSTDRF